MKNAKILKIKMPSLSMKKTPSVYYVRSWVINTETIIHLKKWSNKPCSSIT